MTYNPWYVVTPQTYLWLVSQILITSKELQTWRWCKAMLFYRTHLKYLKSHLYI